MTLAQSLAAKRRAAIGNLGKPRPGRTRGHDGAFNKLRALELLVQGRSCKEIGQDLGRSPGVIRRGLRRGGLRHDSPSVYNVGDRLDAPIILALRNACDFSPQMFAELVGVPTWVVSHLSRKGNIGQRVDPKHARKFIVWRDNLIHKVLSTDLRQRDECRRGAVIRGLFPNLRQKYEQLLAMMQYCRSFLREYKAKEHKDADAEHLFTYLLNQAMYETGHPSGAKPFVQFLPWLPELRPFVEAHLGELRGPGSLQKLAFHAFGDYWKVAAGVIPSLVYRDLEPLSPARMRALILSLPNGAPTSRRTKTKSKQKPGPQPQPAHLRTWYLIGSKVEAEILQHRKQDKFAMIVARKAVAEATHLQPDVVAQYHKRFRRHISSN